MMIQSQSMMPEQLIVIFNIFQIEKSCISFCRSLRRTSVGVSPGWWVMANISCLDKAYLVKGCEYRGSGFFPPLPAPDLQVEFTCTQTQTFPQEGSPQGQAGEEISSGEHGQADLVAHLSHTLYCCYHFHFHLSDLQVYILSDSIPGQGRKGLLSLLSSLFLQKALMQTCGGLTASVKDFKICLFVSCLVSSYAPILIICLFLSHLVRICVTLYFLCPCKMPSVLPGTRQGINMNKYSQHLAPWASGSTSRFAAFQPFGSIQAQSNRLCSCAAIVPQALPLRTSLNS